MLQLSASARHSVQRQCRIVSKLSGLQDTPAQHPKHALSKGDISRVSRNVASRTISSSSAKHAHEVAMSDSRLNAFVPPFILNGKSQPKKEAEADEFWRKIPIWKDVPTEQFMSWSWGVSIVHVLDIESNFVLTDILDEKRCPVSQKIRSAPVQEFHRAGRPRLRPP